MRLPALDPARIPATGSDDLPQRWTIPDTEIEIVLFPDGPRAGQYLFSAATVARLPEFHDRIMHLPPTQNTLFRDWRYQLMAFTGADRIGIPALGLIAGVGVGGVALALAAQSTVENLFGGVSIFVDRPFRIGDFIQYGSGMGTAEAIGPRSTRIRGLDGTLTTVSNGDLAKMHIVDISARNKCLFVQTLGLRYETSRLHLEWILDTMHRRLAQHPMVEEGGGMPRVRLMALARPRLMPRCGSPC